MRGDDHDGIATHGWSREFRMDMKNPAQTGTDWKIENKVDFLKLENHSNVMIGGKSQNSEPKELTNFQCWLNY